MRPVEQQTLERSSVVAIFVLGSLGCLLQSLGDRQLSEHRCAKIEFDDPELDVQQLDRFIFAENGYVREVA